MNRFKRLRKQKELTQTELAELLHVEQSSISNWESDKTLPDYESMVKLANLYKVDLEYLFGIEKMPVSEIGQRLKELADKYELDTLTDEQKEEFLTVVEITAKNFKNRT